MEVRLRDKEGSRRSERLARLFQRLGWERTKTQQRSERDVRVFEPFNQMRYRRSRKKKVRLDETNKKSRNVTAVTGWKSAISRKPGGILKISSAANASLWVVYAFKHLTPVSWGDCTFPHVSLQFTLYKHLGSVTYRPWTQQPTKDSLFPDWFRLYALLHLMPDKCYIWGECSIMTSLTVKNWWLICGDITSWLFPQTVQNPGFTVSHLTKENMLNFIMFIGSVFSLRN